MRRWRTRAALAAASVALLTATFAPPVRDSGGSNPASQDLGGRGPITYVQGKDNSKRRVRPLVDKWNAAHPNEKVTFKEQSDQADQQHDDLVQHFQAKDPNYDVVDVDVVWTAEFAAKGWLQPLTGAIALDTSTLLRPPVKTATYNNTLYARPADRRRHALLPQGPGAQTRPRRGTRCGGLPHRQGARHRLLRRPVRQVRGPDVNAAEAINTFGGTIVGADGKTPTVNTPAGRPGLQMLADAYKNGDIPKQAITYQEEQGRQAFEAGKLLFLRNWPYVYSLAKTDGSSKVKDKFGVAAAAGRERPRRLHAWVVTTWRHQRLLRAQGDRAGLPEVPEQRGDQKFIANRAPAPRCAPSLYTTRR